MAEKKRHHFVPKGYLKAFQDADGMLCVYRKDDPEAEIFSSPDNTGFQKYYYSQPTPDGGKDNNRLEDAFSELESDWPPIVERITNFEDVNDALETIFNFTVLQRVRVPAARDAFEKLQAELVRATAKQLQKQGKLPPPPESLPDDLIDTMLISIDPHRSIHAMVDAIKPIGELFGRMGFDAFHNKTDVDFVTSDNPVIWFDPTVSIQKLQPYQLKPDGAVMLFFPISPKVVLIGNTDRKDHFARVGLSHGELVKRDAVKNINREIVRFAYNTVFAKDDSARPLVRKYADISPVVDVTHIDTNEGQFLVHRSIFGARTKKPKWEPNKNRT